MYKEPLMIRIVVAEDSLTVRKWIVELLENQPEFQVVGEAANGKEATQLAERLKPDVITMDLMMPIMTGLEATEYIMAHCPTRILIVSSSLNRGDVLRTLDALKQGAITAMDKPRADVEHDQWADELIREIKIISRVPVVRHLKGKYKQSSTLAPAVHSVSLPTSVKQTQFKLVVMGASTGGPQVVLHILQNLPKDFPIPILCVIHISTSFYNSLAEWFDLNCKLKVSFAKPNQSIFTYEKGLVYLAPADYHMVLQGFSIQLNQNPLRNFCRPSVDELFESAAKAWGSQTIGVLLTGMGKDGAVGLKAIQAAGGYTIAQDEKSCTVYGMPKEAIDIGAASRIMPYQEVPNTLVELTKY